MMEASRPAPGLLVSVRSAAEAVAALAGGADLIDVKEPSRGSLGRADDETLAAIMSVVAGRRPVSAALGELLAEPDLPAIPGLAFVKWGLAGAAQVADWRQRFSRQLARLRSEQPGCEAVAVAYADGERATSPEPESVAAFAVESGCKVFLLDTWQKDGTTLLDWLPLERIESLTNFCRSAGVRVALAGSLGVEQIAALRSLRPNWFAVRGAVCCGGRSGTVEVDRVRRMGEVVGNVTAARHGS